ncbi:unnamed protein product, partial [Larinioides sclopetarius]
RERCAGANNFCGSGEVYVPPKFCSDFSYYGQKNCCSMRDVPAPIISVDLQRCMFHSHSAQTFPAAAKKNCCSVRDVPSPIIFVDLE